MTKATTKATRTLSDIQFQLLMDAQARQDRAEGLYQTERINFNNIRALIFDALNIESGTEVSLDIEAKKLTLLPNKSKKPQPDDDKKSV